MLKNEINELITRSKGYGWVLEPEAKRILSLAGLDVPRYIRTVEPEEALRFAQEIGYPVVAKVISPKVLHKTDEGGVRIGINDRKTLSETFDRFTRFEAFDGILVEEMLEGIELIVGAKVDYQFGPVILLGLGGTGVEIYHDTVLRMAPLTVRDAEAMVGGLKARRLLEGYRGSEPIDLQELNRTLMNFSDLVMQLESVIESVDLNPLICSEKGCIVADARMILAAPPRG